MSTTSRYLAKFDEVNRLASESFLTGDKKKVKDTFLDFLIEGYLLGVEMACEQLKKKREADVDEMFEVIFLMIDGETFEDRIDKHMDQGSEGMLKTLAESEYHRVFNTAAEKTANAITKGKGTKTWKTMNDLRVRDTHEYLHDMTVPINGVFVTFDGDQARFPGDFEKAENVANCRCWLEFSE